MSRAEKGAGATLDEAKRELDRTMAALAKAARAEREARKAYLVRLEAFRAEHPTI